MKTKRSILVLGVMALICGVHLQAETGEARTPAEEREMVLPEGVSAPQVVRLMRMSDEELASLRKAVEFVESLDEEERQAMRRAIGEMRRGEVSRSGEAERGGPGQGRGQLREEWQAFREAYEKDGSSLEDLPPAERRALFREYIREQRGSKQRMRDER